MSYEAMLALLHASPKQREKINEVLAREEKENARKDGPCEQAKISLTRKASC